MGQRNLRFTCLLRPGIGAGAAAALVCFALTIRAAAQQPARASLPVVPIELVRSAIANEVADQNKSPVRHLFHSRKQTHSGSQTRLYVETRDAMAGMTIAYDDHPLNPQQIQGECARLEHLEANPDELAHKRAQEKVDAERTQRMVRALPDAFLYEYDGTETSEPSAGKEGDQLIRLKFRPNPDYAPPSRVEEVLKGMQGFVLIDPAARRLARIDGTLFKEVTFGWGFFGHLDKGGHFGVQQAALPDGTWNLTRMQLSFTGKILLVKSLNIAFDEILSGFQRVPDDTTFAKGVEMLKAEEAKLAENGMAAGPKAH